MGVRRRGGELAFPWRGELRLRARDGEFRAPARVPFFFCKKKGTKENHSNLRFKDPLARGGQVQIWRCVLVGGVQRSSLSVKRTVPAFTGAEASATACLSHGRGICFYRVGDYQIAPLPPQGGKGRCARWAQDIIACDAAERIIFAVVAGSGSGKLCWHSRGNDNDQKNAGYVRESAGGSEQALRLRAQAGAFRAPARVTFFFCKKKVTKENHSNLRFKDPLARGGQVRIWRC